MPAKDLRKVVASSSYPLDAFLFVQRGLDYTVRHNHGELPTDADTEDREAHHVSGTDLCHGLRAYAIQEYGLLARTVLRRWRIYTCEDFGKIVFAMVEAGLMHKTDEDSLDDFCNVFDFEHAFHERLELSENV
ncbi:Minf_1886 family protein [Phycisphaerales bacterium AB-hyl4]|uniref:Minf_1886 family protein n=1 Tax=Natronomicrosphaera hydrolytica TaxID=3242702 RepID=A0ABV4UBL6_9BACT